MIQTTAKNKVIIGSRESRLAVLQSEMVRDYIKEQHPGLDVEILTMKTTGDKILDRTLDKVGGKGLFVKELDKALLEGRTMLSVHSLKDMPMEVPEDLPLLAFSRREDPRDVLVLPEESHLLKNNDEFFFPDPDVSGLLPQGSAPHILLHPAYAVLSEDFP